MQMVEPGGREKYQILSLVVKLNVVPFPGT